jgi:hypothetical protein
VSRRPILLEIVCVPVFLAAMATSWAAADEPFPYPAPPGRSKPVYLAPGSLPALPAANPEQSRITNTFSPPTTVRKAEAVDEGAAPRGGLVPPVRKSVIADTAETDRRVERLKRQLEELHEILSRPPADPPVIERTIVSPPVEAEAAPGARPIPAGEAAVETPRASESSRPELPHTEPRPEPTGSRDVKGSSTGLIKGLPTAAIDRVYVADNLFAAGEYALANDIYLQVDRRAISGDEAGWVEFQLANCSRRLGRLDDAKKSYRRVVSDPTLGWLQDLAKWRLDAIDDREQLIKDHARLEAAIKQYLETPRATAKP